MLNELGRLVEGTDNNNLTIKDDGDDEENCTIYYRQCPRRGIITTMRVRVWDGASLPEDLLEDYGLRDNNFLSEFVVAEVGRLMAHPEIRSTLHVPNFFCYAAEDMQKRLGVNCLLMSCKPGLVSLYKKMAFNSYSEKLIQYPDGIEIPMVCFLHASSLKKDGIAYHKIAMHTFTNEQENVVNRVKLITKKSIECDKEIILKHYRNFLIGNKPPIIYPKLDTIGILIDSGCYLLNINQPTHITYSGIKESDMYLLMQGSIETEQRPTTEPGVIFGEHAYFSAAKKRRFNRWTERAQLLVIKASALQKVRRQYPVHYQQLIDFIAQNLSYKLAL